MKKHLMLKLLKIAAFEGLMKKLIFTVVTAALLSACSTNPATNAIPTSPILYSESSSDTSIVTVTRDSGVLGSACSMKLSVDDNIVAKLKPSDSVTLHIPSGRHILSFDTRGGLCPSVTDAIDMTLSEGDVKKYRIRGDMNGNFQLLPTL